MMDFLPPVFPAVPVTRFLWKIPSKKNPVQTQLNFSSAENRILYRFLLILWGLKGPTSSGYTKKNHPYHNPALKVRIFRLGARQTARKKPACGSPPKEL